MRWNAPTPTYTRGWPFCHLPADPNGAQSSSGARFAEPTHEAAFLAREGLDGARLIEWMTMTQEEFSRRFKDSPVKRTKRRGLLCNVAVALGSWGSPEAVPALSVALNDEEPLVCGHAAWALGRIGTEAVRQALRGREEVEEDAWVW